MKNTLKAHSTILSMLLSRGINNNEYITRIKKLTGNEPIGVMDALNLSKQDVRKYVDMMNTKYDIELFKLSELNEPYDTDRYNKLTNEQNAMHAEYKEYMSKINPLLSKQW